MRRVRVGVVGCGYWGPNIVRSLAEIPEAKVVAVADRDPARLGVLGSRHPQIEYCVDDYRRLIHLDLDAVVVATSPETHYAIASDALEEGLDVFVEKPLATSSAEALALTELADANDRILLVGHIGAYNPAVRALRDIIQSGELGEIRYVDAIRAGLGLFHPNLNVVWDLAPHDVSIFLYLFGRAPVSVSTRGIACVREDVEDVAYLTLMLEGGILAHTRMSWLDPLKIRRITVVGSKKMAVYDDLDALEKLKIYDKTVSAIRRTDTFGEAQFAYHYGNVVSPFIQFAEPLRVECDHFLACVRNRTRPITDGSSGVEVVRVIEAAQRSLREGGIPVSVRTGDPALPFAELLGAYREGNGSKGGGSGRRRTTRDILIDLSAAPEIHEVRAPAGEPLER